ncbi:hypothetical protein Vadar_012473 [Vaccinium darrowii]|uniref:Uncharacterized protein n=1 Tax=Vaccinium darrowii TaxID=229202 RepID=A0ACB7XI86_9ERIC|nr:hypothetical protein Vadar_012473 [Vaccinium darrowii]
MDEYIDEIRGYDQQLEAVGYHVDGDDLVFYTLKGLPEEYKPIRSALNVKGDIMFSDLATILKNEESQILRDEGSTAPKVFLANPKNLPNEIKNSGQASSSTTTQFASNDILGAAPQVYQVPMYQTSQPSGEFFPIQTNRNFSGGQNSRGGKGSGFGQNNKVECQICGKPNHTAMYCYHRQNLQYQPSSSSQFSKYKRGQNSGMSSSWNGPMNHSWNGASNGVMYNTAYTPVISVVRQSSVGNMNVVPQNSVGNMTVLPQSSVGNMNVVHQNSVPMQRSFSGNGGTIFPIPNTGTAGHNVSHPQANVINFSSPFSLTTQVPVQYQLQGGSAVVNGPPQAYVATGPFMNVGFSVTGQQGHSGSGNVGLIRGVPLTSFDDIVVSLPVTSPMLSEEIHSGVTNSTPEFPSSEITNSGVTTTPSSGVPNFSPEFPSTVQSSEITFVKPGKTYLLRLINAALNDELFFRISYHSLTVVEADAIYIQPFQTETLLIAPGQTTNVLLKTLKLL